MWPYLVYFGLWALCRAWPQWPSLPSPTLFKVVLSYAIATPSYRAPTNQCGLHMFRQNSGWSLDQEAVGDEEFFRTQCVYVSAPTHTLWWCGAAREVEAPQMNFPHTPWGGSRLGGTNWRSNTKGTGFIPNHKHIRSLVVSTPLDKAEGHANTSAAKRDQTAGEKK